MKFGETKQSNKQDHTSVKLNSQNTLHPVHQTSSFSRNIMQLQKTMGNQGVLQLLRNKPSTSIKIAQMAFANDATKTGHFTKHGSEFSSADEDTYESEAETFTAKADSGTKQSKVRANGDTVHFDSTTDEFSIVTSGGVHRTYFKPEPSKHGLADNQAYYDSQ